MPIFSDERFASEHYVLRAFAIPTACIDIGAVATRTLSHYEIAHVVIFANQLVGGAEVEDQFCTFQHCAIAWRDGCPKVFADLNAEGRVLMLEQLL